MDIRKKTILCCGGLSLVLLGFGSGCAMLPPNSFIDPTRVGMFPSEYREGGIRRVLTPREGPIGLANATEPVPEDLVVSYQEYRLGITDQVGVVINDLLQSGFPYQATLEISETGYIRIPELGMLKVVGLTDRELEREIITRLQEGGILPNPIVQVFTTIKRNNVFQVIGSVSRPGSYSLAKPDTRLLDVIGMVGDIGPLARRAYIIRRTEPTPSTATEGRGDNTGADEGLVIPPPTDDDPFESTLSAGLGIGLQEPPEEEPEQAVPTEQELEEILAPPAQTPPADTQQEEPGKRRFAPLIFDPTTGTLKEAPGESEAQDWVAAPESGVAEGERPEFDWEAVPEYELSQRVIEIDIPALKSGDPRYNIVVRPLDMINVPVDTGVYYMMGEVARPGVYSFGGREITIKQAIASVGGFGRLAWPSRCEIVRREQGTDKQITIPVNLDHVFYGLEDDLLLRDDDIVNVGTDVIAPFLYIIRNSFRFTYGFGFVYDRNFADKDAYGSQINPETLKIQRRQAQGLPW